MTFVEYVGFYGLARSEGLVLRYLADAYKALRQTVPEDAKTEELHRPHRVARRAGPPGRLQPARRVGAAAQPATREAGRPGVERAGRRRSPRNARAFRVLVRNALFRRVELAALRRYDELGELDARGRLGRRRLGATALEPYFDEHDEIGTGPDARGPALLHHRAERRTRWTVRQILDDPAGDHDWGISAEVDLAASDATGSAAIRIVEVGQL